MAEYLPELRGIDGKMFTGNFGPASPEQVEAIQSVLDRREREQAEREYLARREQRERAKLREQEQAEKCRKILNAHRELVASATGLRKAILERGTPRTATSVRSALTWATSTTAHRTSPATSTC